MPCAITGWKTSDGKLFDDQHAATVHEAIVRIKAEVPDLKDRIEIVQANADLLANIFVPLANLSQKPPFPSAETTLDLLGNPEPEVTLKIKSDPAAPIDNLPKGWSYVESFDNDEGHRTDTYEDADGGRVDWPRENPTWPASMAGKAIKRFGKDAPLGCAHVWHINGGGDLVDVCVHCGESRA